MRRATVVAAIRRVNEDDEILVVTEQGMLIRVTAAEIRRSGRSTQGVRVIRLDDEDRVVSVARAEPADDEYADDEADDQAGETSGSCPTDCAMPCVLSTDCLELACRQSLQTMKACYRCF